MATGQLTLDLARNDAEISIKETFIRYKRVHWHHERYVSRCFWLISQAYKVLLCGKNYSKQETGVVVKFECGY